MIDVWRGVLAVRAAGWAGPVDVSESDDGHVHVRWNGRHVEGVSVEACAEFIRRDAAAREAEAEDAAVDAMLAERDAMLAEENEFNRRQAECRHDGEIFTIGPAGMCAQCRKKGPFT